MMIMMLMMTMMTMTIMMMMTTMTMTIMMMHAIYLDLWAAAISGKRRPPIVLLI